MKTNINIESARRKLRNDLVKSEPGSFYRTFPNGANVGETLVLFQLSIVVVPEAIRETMLKHLDAIPLKNITDIEDYHGDVKDLLYFFADGRMKGLEPNDDVLTDAITTFALSHEDDDMDGDDRR